MKKLMNCLLVFALIFNLFTIPAFAEESGLPVSAASESLGASNCYDELSSEFTAHEAKVRLITNNVEAWYARWYMISSAKRTIDTTYFIVDKDIFGMSFLGLLMKKAKEGVKVRLMMDARGSMDLTKVMTGMDYLQELVENPNVEIKVYNPLASNLVKVFGNIRNIISSNHDKIIIVDDELCITGGRNIEMNYFVSPKDVAKVYRDTDVLIQNEGIAAQMKTAFNDEFNSHAAYNVKKEIFGNWVSREKELDLARRAMQNFMNGMGLMNPEQLTSDKEALVKYNEELVKYPSMQSYSAYIPFTGDHIYPSMILDKHSFKGTLNNITPSIIKLIDNAKSEIIIQNPYLVITDDVFAALQRANDRGVKINVHTNSPGSTDSAITQAFFLYDWKSIMAKMRNLRMFGFKGETQLHSKVFVFDREVTIVGTYNMDPMSEQINSENVLVIKSKPFAVRTALRIAEDEKNSIEYKVNVDKNGNVESYFGPDSHSDPEKLKKLNFLHKFGFLRPLI